MNNATQPIDTRRGAAIAAALVAAVVIVIGFGAGIGSVFSRNAAAPTSLFKVSPGAATPIQTVSGVSDGGIAAGVSHAVAKLGTAGGVLGGGAVKATPAAHGGTAAAPSDAGTCATEPLTSAMLNPFFLHFNAAHLETGPGQQVADILNLDQYTKTHTVLIENMFTPLVNVLLGGPAALSPFFVHFNAAHLETSPGQQIADATNIDQYTKTHTILIENMLSPLSSGITATGC